MSCLDLPVNCAGRLYPYTANIAEGFKRRGRADKVRFLNIAQSSLEECRYYLILAADLSYAETDSAMALLEESSRCLEAYVKRILTSDF